SNRRRVRRSKSTADTLPGCIRFPNANATGQGVGGGFASPYAAPIARQATGFPYRRRRRFSGMTWLIIAIVALFAMGGGLSALKRRVGNAPGISINFNRTYFGVDGFRGAPGGVTFENVEPPDGP